MAEKRTSDSSVVDVSSERADLSYPSPIERYEKDQLRAEVRSTSRRAVLTPAERDAYILAKSGKKQVLKRRFGLLSVSGLATATMVTWESVVTNLSLGLAK